LANPPTSTLLKNLRDQGDLYVTAGVFAVLMIMVVPLPPWIMDGLLAISVSLAVLIMFVTFYVADPLEFSVFPTLLLVTTLFRLSLNVASTRLILLHGSEGADAAGNIIMAFGKVAVGGNYAVGIVVFIILVVINFMVITKGAGRIAEVAARFTLDAMPGKQMAIDAELNAGLIDEREAKRRRLVVGREADFFGAMDGASKFIRGDAIAGILITVVNIVGGLFIGVIQQKADLSIALQNYTVLTIGDGLVSQVPALVISTAAGMLVTRVPNEESPYLAGQLGSQLFGSPRALAMMAAALVLFSIMPGLRLPFLAVASAAVYTVWRKTRAPKQPEFEMLPEAGAPSPTTALPLDDLLKVEPLSIELGVDLLALVEERKGGALVERIQRIRQQFAQNVGLVVPPVHLRDNLRLASGEYRVLLRGEELGRGKVYARQSLAIDPGDARGPIRGIKGKDPVFGLDAYWIADAARLQAQTLGYTVVDIPTILTTHLSELLMQHGHELFGRQELADVLDRTSKVLPRLIEELVPDMLTRGAVLKVFRNLLREGVSIRDTHTIFETLAEYALRSKDPDVLTELCRQRLARHLTRHFQNVEGVIYYIALAPDVEEALSRGLQPVEGGLARLVLDPNDFRRLLSRLTEVTQQSKANQEAVLLCPPLARAPLRQLIEKALPRIAVLSPAELLPTAKLEKIAEISFRPDDTPAPTPKPAMRLRPDRPRAPERPDPARVETP